MNKYKNKAFTLAELIVTIFILIVLWAISYIAYQWYSSDARDSVRISNGSKVKLALELFKEQTWNYPLPDDKFTMKMWTWVILWYQWFVGDNFVQQTKILSEVPTDPKTWEKIVYSTTYRKDYFQIKYDLESDISSMINNKTYAVFRLSNVTWNYPWPTIVWSDYTHYSAPTIIINKTILETESDWTTINLVWQEEKLKFYATNLVIDHKLWPLLNSFWEPITLWNIQYNFFDFIFAIQEAYKDNPDIQKLVQDNPPFKDIVNADPTDWASIDRIIKWGYPDWNWLTWWEKPDCKPWTHQVWSTCVKDYMKVWCNAVWKPLRNSEYTSSNATIYWNNNTKSRSTAQNCPWICIDWYWWWDCTIPPHWEITDEWWSCSETCWWWTQKKIVKCVNDSWWNVAEKFCKTHAVKPDINQTCNTQVCVYDWTCWPAAREYWSEEQSFSQDYCTYWQVTWWSLPNFPAIDWETTWTCDWVNWWQVSEQCSATRVLTPENGSCWNASRTVKWSIASLQWMELCVSWFYNGSNVPEMPEIWWSVTWECEWINWWTTANCQLTRDWIHWECWTASNAYDYNTTWYPTWTYFCKQWTIAGGSEPSFPTMWNDVSWYCDWIDDWETSSECNASRSEYQIDGNCWSADWVNYWINEVSYWNDSFCTSWQLNEIPFFPEFWYRLIGLVYD